MMVTDNKMVRGALARLKGITGFVTALCHESDPRPSVFNRYDHINRVWWVNQRICEILNKDPSQSSDIVLLHDLNRWPFAHNAERGFFSQAKNTAEYLSGLDPDIPAPVIFDITMLHAKSLRDMREDSQSALVSDLIAGLVEDPLMLIAGLNIHPDLFPKKIAELLMLDFSTGGICVLKELCAALNIDKNVTVFLELFRELYENQCNKLFEKYFTKLGVSAFEIIVRDALHVKKTFFRPVIFPINNESICNASWIQNALIAKIVLNLGYNEANRYLLSIDEFQFLDFVRGKGYASELALMNIYPHLDYSSNATGNVTSFIRLDS